MSIRTRVLVWVEPNSQPVEVGIFDFEVPPSPQDMLALSKHPVLLVNWRKFAPPDAEADGVQLLLGCSYDRPATTPPPAESPLDALEDQQTRINNKLRDNQKIIGEIQGRSFKDAATYVNVIVIAGYAAIFTIWSNVKAIVSPMEIASVAALLLFSIVVFVAFELTKMIILSLSMRRNVAAAMRDPMIEDYLSKLIEAEQTGMQRMGIFMKAWPLVLALTILPALTAAVVLFWKFYGVVSPSPPGAP